MNALGVVVADDDEDIRTLVAIAVAKAGLELIDELSDGDSAWDAIQTFEPDIAVLDVSMPGLSGLDVCRLVRADRNVADMWLIILSAAVNDAAVEAGLAAGANEYFTKPFSPRALAERLGTIAAELNT